MGYGICEMGYGIWNTGHIRLDMEYFLRDRGCGMWDIGYGI